MGRWIGKIVFGSSQGRVRDNMTIGLKQTTLLELPAVATFIWVWGRSGVSDKGHIRLICNPSRVIS